jgi:hypothetical protein
MSDETTNPLQAELDALKARLADQDAKIKQAASIQTAFKSLRQHNGPAADYLEALAQGQTPAPFWETSEPTVETTVDYDDLDGSKQMQAMQAQFEQKLEQMSNQLLGIVDQKFNAVSQPLMNMRVDATQAKVQQEIDAEFGDGSFEKYREAASAMAEGPAGVLLQTADGLKALMKAAIASDARQLGADAGRNELLSRARTANDVYGGPTPGGAKGSNADITDGLDFSGDGVDALAQFYERADLSGASLQLEE